MSNNVSENVMNIQRNNTWELSKIVEGYQYSDQKVMNPIPR